MKSSISACSQDTNIDERKNEVKEGIISKPDMGQGLGRGSWLHVGPRRWQEEAPGAAQETGQGDGGGRCGIQAETGGAEGTRGTESEGQGWGGKAPWPQVELRNLAKSTLFIVPEEMMIPLFLFKHLDSLLYYFLPPVGIEISVFLDPTVHEKTNLKKKKNLT